MTASRIGSRRATIPSVTVAPGGRLIRHPLARPHLATPRRAQQRGGRA